jgi:hypothetical protein
MRKNICSPSSRASPDATQGSLAKHMHASELLQVDTSLLEEMRK